LLFGSSLAAALSVSIWVGVRGQAALPFTRFVKTLYLPVLVAVAAHARVAVPLSSSVSDGNSIHSMYTESAARCGAAKPAPGAYRRVQICVVDELTWMYPPNTIPALLAAIAGEYALC